MKIPFALTFLNVAVSAHAQTIHSPSNKLALRLSLSAAGEPTYQLSYGNKPVLKPSRLGVLVKD